MTLAQLRQQHPRFIYDSFQAGITSQGLEIEYCFEVENKLGPQIKFHPTLILEKVSQAQWQALPDNFRQKWVFQLGLAELFSYWKATASPEIIIKAGALTPAQITWWQKLLLRGMGEYFYVNQIDFTQENFVTWRVETQQQVKNKESQALTPNLVSLSKAAQDAPSYLVPMGGGKDSTLTACLLNHQQIPFAAFLLNPTPAMQQITQLVQPQQVITARREIDPKLLELNQAGYLNGHVPFSAYLGFLSRFAGIIFGYQSVVISNERSSNEGNVQFKGSLINHQYSKSFEFEKDFVDYLKQNKLMPADFLTQPKNMQPEIQLGAQSKTQLSTQPSYFSLLRPLYELQISQLLVKCPNFDQLASVFRSCNRGQKTNSWCGECPKCLFTFTSLYPFIAENKLITIFGNNLFEKISLLDEAQALLGKTTTKPFECVGTHEESLAAFYLSIQKIQASQRPLPVLLQQIWTQIILPLAKQQPNLQQRTQRVLQSWNTNHHLPATLEQLLKNAVA